MINQSWNKKITLFLFDNIVTTYQSNRLTHKIILAVMDFTSSSLSSCIKCFPDIDFEIVFDESALFLDDEDEDVILLITFQFNGHFLTPQ